MEAFTFVERHDPKSAPKSCELVTSLNVIRVDHKQPKICTLSVLKPPLFVSTRCFVTTDSLQKMMGKKQNAIFVFLFVWKQENQ